MTLRICPMPGCKGDLRPHCDYTDPRTRSTACDIVTCDRCSASGSLDGRWWPKAARTQTFAELEAVANELRKDVAQ